MYQIHILQLCVTNVETGEGVITSLTQKKTQATLVRVMFCSRHIATPQPFQHRTEQMLRSASLFVICFAISSLQAIHYWVGKTRVKTYKIFKMSFPRSLTLMSSSSSSPNIFISYCWMRELNWDFKIFHLLFDKIVHSLTFWRRYYFF